MSSAAFKLKAQHTPLSVGNGLKIAAHSMGFPLHKQYLRKDVSQKVSSTLLLVSFSSTFYACFFLKINLKD